jgi:hypothetical protein
VYQALFHSLGVDAYWPYRVFGLAGYAFLGVEVFRFTRRRAGDAAALLAVTAVMWSSAATTNVMFPFLVNYSLPIACLVAVWRALDRDTPRADVVGSAFLALALATSGLGLMVVAAVFVELVWRRAALRRWLTFAPGPLLWLAWWAGHSDSTPITHEVGTGIKYAARMFLGGTTALAAGWKPGGVLLAIGFVALVVASIVWRTFDGRTLGALIAPLAFIATTALTRTSIVPAIPPDEVRYRWAVATYLVLAVVILCRGARVRLAGGTAIAAFAVVMVLLAAGGVRLVGDMGDWNDMVVANEPGIRAMLLAVEQVPHPISGNLAIPLSYVRVTNDAYLEAVADVGSPLAGHRFLGPGGHLDQVHYADHYMFETTTFVSGVSGTAAGCRPLPPDASVPAGTTFAVDASASGAPVTVRVARFGPMGDAPVVTVSAGLQRRFALPRDPSYVDATRVPYRLSAPAGVSLSTCD